MRMRCSTVELRARTSVFYQVRLADGVQYRLFCGGRSGLVAEQNFKNIKSNSLLGPYQIGTRGCWSGMAERQIPIYSPKGGFEMKRVNLLMAIMLLATLVLAACGPAAQAARTVICPLNVQALQEGETKECVVWDGVDLSVDKATRYAKYPAMLLGPNQAGIYQPFGSAETKIYRANGYVDAPAPTSDASSMSFIVDEVAVDIFTASSCPEAKANENECVGPLDNIQLRDGITAVTDYSFGGRLVVTQENVALWMELRGYNGFKNEFWKETRRYKNIVSDLIPDFSVVGNTIQAMQDRFNSRFADWKYIVLVAEPNITLKGTVIGDQALRDAMAETRAEQAKAQAQGDLLDQLMANEEKRQQLELMRANFMATLEANRAESFAVQVATVCADIPDVDACTRRVWVYLSGQENPPTLDNNGDVTGQTGTP